MRHPPAKLPRMAVALSSALLAQCHLDEGAETGTPPEAAVEPGWSPPVWLPDGGPVSAWAIEDLDGAPAATEGPELSSRAVFLADLDRGEVLLARDPDTRYPVASLTKLVSALALAAEDPDLDRRLCVGPEQYPTRAGARSRFETGVCHTGWEWLGAALVASDNRGAMGMPYLAGMRYEDFIDRMGEAGAEVGMQLGRWADPSGLEVGNQASARDMAKAVTAVAAHPVLSMMASAPTWTIDRSHGPQTLHTTNRLIERWDTLAAKTGYTDPAGYCFAQVVQTERGGTYVVVVLGAPSSGARFGDAERLVTWADALDGGGSDPGDAASAPPPAGRAPR